MNSLLARFGVLATAAMLVACASTANPKVSDEDAARFNVQLGINYLQRGDLQEAREKLERAVDQDPSFPEAHAALGILYERVGELDRAGQHLRRATQLAPDDPNMINNYGGFLCRRGERSEGIKYFQRAASNAFYRTPEVAWTNAGVCARGIPDLEAAEQYFRRALEVNRNHSEALLQLADMNLAQGDGFGARAFLQRYEAVARATPYSLELGRRIEAATGDDDAVQMYTRRLLQEFPESPEARRLQR
ncbi:MAG: type IV pilus biogenesis/stability protein PilW [Gammaproteobacteria bacterium]|jgi:type IV pilus assembly protein PilF